jgi:hypothetical protein
MTRLTILALTGLMLCATLAGQAHADPQIPQFADDVHLGVATCASSVCHGSIKPRQATRVLQNEYVVWSRLDAHRSAYQTLLSEESAWIAKNLGLPNAQQASICLDCHGDNVASTHQGSRFQISDGIGCESCHGGAERYLTSHTDPDRTHQQNVADGLYPTDNVESRAQLCFSCHIGHESKIASHEIMGAGHPRLGFELDTFTVLQPAHFVVDEDYLDAKWHADSVSVWALGQIEAGYQSLRLIDAHLNTDTLFPELSLFDCHSCHHPMSDLKWESQGRVGLPPGAVRLNDAGFVMLLPISAVLPGDRQELEQGIRNLQVAVHSNKQITLRVQQLRDVLDGLKTAATGAQLDSEKLLSEIVAMAGDGEFHDYVAAEQAVMAIDLLSSHSGKRELNADRLEKMYQAVADEDVFDPYKFADLFIKN